MKSIRFLHIPKTAGNTFTGIIKRQYSGKLNFEFSGDVASDIKKYELLPKHNKENLILFTGHAPIVTDINKADRAITITFLRDPISRVKSFCQHVSEGKCSYLIDDFPPERFNLDAFLESGINELSDLQTKMLICDRTYTLFDQLSAAEVIDLALSNLLRKISHFGLQEYFDESLILFSSALNWQLPVYTSQNVKNINKLIRFEQRHLDKIKELNEIDIVVYGHAKANFLESIDNVAFDKSKLNRFKFINKFACPVVKIKNRIIRTKMLCSKGFSSIRSSLR